MGDNLSSFFERFYNYGNPKDVNLEHVRHQKCDPNQKSFVSMFFDKLAKPYADKRNEEGKCSRQRQPPKGNIELSDDKQKECKEESAKDAPSESTDDALPKCFIKEQNPLAPPCCEAKSDDEDDEDNAPCPPAGYPQDPRVPSCGCDRCRKSGYHGRCCDRRTYIQQSAEPPPRLERA